RAGFPVALAVSQITRGCPEITDSGVASGGKLGSGLEETSHGGRQVMKKTISLLALLTAALLVLSAQAFAQEKAPIKVKGSEVVTGVVIVHVQKGGKTLDLQC